MMHLLVCLLLVSQAFGKDYLSPGPLFGTGWNTYNQLAITNSSDASAFTQILNVPNSDTTGTPILAIITSCGYGHTIIVSVDGDVYTTGMNKHGQLGLGDFSNRRSFLRVPAFRESELFVTFCAAGHDFSLCITDAGLLYSFGNNEKGQLGLGDRVSRTNPLNVVVADALTTVNCGYRHTLAVSVSGDVWGFGWNKYGQLGTGDQVDRLLPIKISSLSVFNIIQVGAGYAHSVALTDDGQAYAWGMNRKGQLGSWNTTTLLSPSKIRKQSAGVMFLISISGLYHTIMSTDSGEIWLFGSNNNGQLGLGYADFNAHPVPALLRSPAALLHVPGVLIVAGAYHSLALFNNQVWGWGWNKNNQIGNWDVSGGAVAFSGLTPRILNIPLVPNAPSIPVVLSLGAGYAHTIITSQYGDHANCGYNRYGVYVCMNEVEQLPTLSTDFDVAPAISVSGTSSNIQKPPMEDK